MGFVAAGVALAFFVYLYARSLEPERPAVAGLGAGACPGCGVPAVAVGGRCPRCGAALGAASDPGPVEYAGFWVRLGAYVVDRVLVSACVAAVGLLVLLGVAAFAGLAGGASGRASAGYAAFVALVGGFAALLVFAGSVIVVDWLYSALFEASKWQGTPGKMAFRIKVVGVGGGRLGFGSSSVRYAVKALTGAFPPLYLFVAFDGRKQALHDKAAECLVVRGR